VRTLIATFAGATAIGTFLIQAHAGVIRRAVSPFPVWVEQILYLATLSLIAFLVGFVVMRRGWLAALAAYVLGVALYVGLYLRPSPPWAPSDVWGLETWISFILTLVPIGIGSAIVAGVGSWVARRRHGFLHQISTP
jgi:hypothetical protein